MTEIRLSKEQQELVISKLQDYFANELNYELGSFDAQFLIDFISEELGLYFYNQGILDTQALLSNKFDDIQDLIAQLEKFPNTKLKKRK